MCPSAGVVAVNAAVSNANCTAPCTTGSHSHTHTHTHTHSAAPSSTHKSSNAFRDRGRLLAPILSSHDQEVSVVVLIGHIRPPTWRHARRQHVVAGLHLAVCGITTTTGTPTSCTSCRCDGSVDAPLVGLESGATRRKAGELLDMAARGTKKP